MNYNYLLSVIIALCIVVSFIKVNKSRAEIDRVEAVAVIDEYINGSKNKNDTGEDLLGEMEEPNSNSLPGSQDTKTYASSSKLETMTDRYGNKTETRCFDFHPRLRCVMLSTSADGQRKIFVYGQNGDVKGLPENMLDRAMTASADDIANAAGIVLAPTRLATPPAYAQTNKTQKVMPPLPPLQTMPNNPSQIPIQNQTTEPEKTETVKEAKPTTDNTPKNTQSVEDSSYQKLNKEMPPVRRKPEEK